MLGTKGGINNNNNKINNNKNPRQYQQNSFVNINICIGPEFSNQCILSLWKSVSSWKTEWIIRSNAENNSCLHDKQPYMVIMTVVSERQKEHDIVKSPWKPVGGQNA